MSKYGILAQEYCKVRLENQVLKSGAGYYIGTVDQEGPCSRESVEYWPTRDKAVKAFETGEWNQRDNP